MITNNRKLHLTMELTQPVKFLLVEDDDSHAKLIMYAFNKNNIANEIDRISNGYEVMPYLKQEGEFKDKRLPGVILLDLNIPGIDGLNVLKSIKTSAEFQHIPIVILTTSKSLSDRQQAYSNYVNSYLVKPVNFQKFHQMIKDLGLYWGLWNVPPNDD